MEENFNPVIFSLKKEHSLLSMKCHISIHSVTKFSSKVGNKKLLLILNGIPNPILVRTILFDYDEKESH